MKIFINVFFFCFIAVLSSLVKADDAIPVEHLRPMMNASPIEDKDSKLFLYFWASWCPDCREKLTGGVLKGLQSEFPKVKVLTVNSDRDDSRGKSFAEGEKISLPIMRDDDRLLTKSLKLFAVPGWAVLEKKDGKWTLKKSSTGADLTEIKAELKGVSL